MDIESLRQIFLDMLPDGSELNLCKVQRRGSPNRNEIRAIRLIFSSLEERNLVLTSKSRLRHKYPTVFFHPMRSREELTRYAALRTELQERLSKGERKLTIQGDRIVPIRRKLLWTNAVKITKSASPP